MSRGERDIMTTALFLGVEPIEMQPAILSTFFTADRKCHHAQGLRSIDNC